MLTTLASFRRLHTGFIAEPFPIPGLPTSTVNKFGYNLYDPRPTNTFLFSALLIAVAAHQKL